MQGRVGSGGRVFAVGDIGLRYGGFGLGGNVFRYTLPGCSGCLDLGCRNSRIYRGYRVDVGRMLGLPEELGGSF